MYEMRFVLVWLEGNSRGLITLGLEERLRMLCIMAARSAPGSHQSLRYYLGHEAFALTKLIRGAQRHEPLDRTFRTGLA